MNACYIPLPTCLLPVQNIQLYKQTVHRCSTENNRPHCCKSIKRLNASHLFTSVLEDSTLARKDVTYVQFTTSLPQATVNITMQTLTFRTEDWA